MGKGDCYEVHARFLRDQVEADEQEGWLLCHGTVTNAAGNSIEHCWLEHDGFAYDLSNGKQLELPVSRFRELTKARNIRTYSSEDVSVNLIRHRHYGPWE